MVADAVDLGIDIGEAEESVEERRAATAQLAAAELGAEASPAQSDATNDCVQRSPARFPNTPVFFPRKGKFLRLILREKMLC